MSTAGKKGASALRKYVFRWINFFPLPCHPEKKGTNREDQLHHRDCMYIYRFVQKLGPDCKIHAKWYRHKHIIISASTLSLFAVLASFWEFQLTWYCNSHIGTPWLQALMSLLGNVIIMHTDMYLSPSKAAIAEDTNGSILYKVISTAQAIK